MIKELDFTTIDLILDNAKQELDLIIADFKFVELAKERIFEEQLNVYRKYGEKAFARPEFAELEELKVGLNKRGLVI